MADRRRDTVGLRITRIADGDAGLLTDAIEHALARRGHAVPTPEEELLRRVIDEKRLAKSVAELPPVFREVLLRADVDGLTYQEIAQRCELPIGTVMSRLFRARRHVRRALAGRGAPSRGFSVVG